MKAEHLIDRPSYAPIEEAQADEFIWTDPDMARMLLDRGIEATLNEPILDRDRYHKLALKRATLPLYELAVNGVSEERVDRAFDVYGELAELLAQELLHLERCADDIEQKKSRGRIAEIAVQCLAARDLQYENPTIVLLPATQDDDVFSPVRDLGTDYYLTSIKGEGDVIYPIQLKNKLTRSLKNRYRPPINTIGLNQIDPHYRNQFHPESISSMMLRELDGQGTEEEAHALAMATFSFYTRVSQQSTAGFTTHPTKPGWVKLSA